jgi:hypothetical protein
VLIKDTKFTFSEISFELGFQSYGNFAMPLKDNRKDSNLSGSFILEGSLTRYLIVVPLSFPLRYFFIVVFVVLYVSCTISLSN